MCSGSIARTTDSREGFHSMFYNAFYRLPVLWKTNPTKRRVYKRIKRVYLQTIYVLIRTRVIRLRWFMCSTPVGVR